MANLDFLDAEIIVDDPILGGDYAYIQWVNGDARQKAAGGIGYTGGFFISSEAGIETLPGFEPYTLMTQDGKEIPGLAAREITFSPIRLRRAWSAKPSEEGLALTLPNNAYDLAKNVDMKGKPTGRGHLLIMLKGYDTELVLTFKGTASRSVFSGGKDLGIVPDFSGKIVNRARQIAKSSGQDKNFPLCAFFVTVGSERDGKGAPVFTEVGTGDNTSRVTMPSWLDRPKGIASDKDISAVYVGGELLAKHQEVHTDATEWVAAWSPKTLLERLTSNAEVQQQLAAAQLALSGMSGESGLPAANDAPF